MTELFSAAIGALILVHGYIYISYNTTDACAVAVQRSIESPVDALSKPRDVVALGRGDDMFACYKIALLGPGW